MKKLIKTSAAVTGCVVALNAVCGCTRVNIYTDARMEELAEAIAMTFLSGDAYSMNVMTVDAKNSYGVDRVEDPRYYMYSETTDDDIDSVLYALRYYDKQLKNFKPSKLGAASASTYRYARQLIDKYLEYYESPYTKEFELIGADYINSSGGYVADFASMVENYAFRCKADVDELLTMTLHVDESFATYLDYMDDREDADMPLYYYSVNGMQEYLDEITELGDDYYLYEFVDNKIDGTTFLSAAEKTQYKTQYAAALKNHFMHGVKELSDGLAARKGDAIEVEQSYLAEYGQIGRAYYDWCFRNKTGFSSVDYVQLFQELSAKQTVYAGKLSRAASAVSSLSPAEQADFEAYAEGDKVLLGLTDPEDMLDFLKELAKSYVPDLKSEPTIDFKYMDRTAAEITNVGAYYLHSPADEIDSPEHITINPVYAEQYPSETLMTVAHEGYPGHLYAYVNAKENGANIMSLGFSCTAFSEGWARYTECSVLDYIAAESDDRAVKLYCEYKKYEMLVENIGTVLYDLNVNYFGSTVSDLVDSGIRESTARIMIETLMEMPTAFVSYGYGLYSMMELHDRARVALGDDYNEVEVNGRLLSEGMGPSLDRAKEIIDEYIG